MNTTHTTTRARTIAIAQARPASRVHRAIAYALASASAAIVLSACIARVAFAHPIHTTLTKVTSDDHSVTLNIRAFADDFSAVVAKFAGRAAPRDSSAPPADVLRYLRAQLVIVDATGHALPLESCGVRRADELYWLCLKATVPAGTRGARIRNAMLTELHPDQVNIVQLEGPGARRTMLFTKGSVPALIGG